MDSHSFRHSRVIYDDDSPWRFTGFNLLTGGLATIYVVYRLILLVFGWHTVPSIWELNGVGVIWICLYWLRRYQFVDPPIYPRFFHEDLKAHAAPYIRTVVVFFLAFFIPLGMAAAPMFTAVVTGGSLALVIKVIGGPFLLDLFLFFFVLTFVLLVATFAWNVLVVVFGDISKALVSFATDRRTARTLHNVVDSIAGLSGFGLAVTFFFRTLLPWINARLGWVGDVFKSVE